ncbi:TolB family protein [Pseudoalteromonas piscicida]|uniref:TolB family protein n=1 Tax=Pseudoalteromonas piscicida TaxID=43662 RepID=UPI0027E4713E|nr:hypothetical protein [Pseudoalteromonas piscicida]WMO15910.1 hypothetical protein NI376_21985 [Pseudoalteromonas piscicida]
MTNKIVQISFVTLAILMSSCEVAEAKGTFEATSGILKGPYLGQTPPGLIAKPFAPGIVNTEEWGDSGGFSLDMNKFYVSRWKHTSDAKEPESLVFTRVGNSWQKAMMAKGERRPFFSPDGKTLRYGAKYKERTAEGWSEMKSLGPAFEKYPIMGLSASAKGTLVFDERTSDGNGVLRYSLLIDGKRQPPEPLSKAINTGKWNAHPYIAPDESYIMWDSVRETGFGSSDLYISFRAKDGSWGEAINLGDKVNTEAEEGGPHFTPDGKYFFFSRMVPHANGKKGSQSDLYWIDAQFIKDLKPKD